MVAHRRHDLVASRRRVADDGEDEDDGPDAADDSLSEASALTDLKDDDDADAEGSDISEQHELEPSKKANGHVKAAVAAPNGTAEEPPPEKVDGTAPTDTDAMLNGLAVPEQTATADEVQFEDMASDGGAQPVVPSAEAGTILTELPHERRRREQDEYRKKRDADPTFEPNRGGFFMHDHRHAGPAANGFRPFGRGRGRGRGGVGGPFSPAG